jgi:uncharacterized protein YecE (DUF72 family)
MTEDILTNNKLMSRGRTKSKIQSSKFNVQIGCQGWNYKDWMTKASGDTIFYPRGIRSNVMLETYAQIFGTVEVDSTFYAIPASSAVDNWYKKTPDDFTFSLKMPQEITHEYGLREPSFPMMHESKKNSAWFWFSFRQILKRRKKTRKHCANFWRNCRKKFALPSSSEIVNG